MVSCLLVCLLIIKVAYSTDYFEQGNVFYGGGRLIEAESAYLLHLSTHASHADCLCNLASIYHDTGRIEDAERTYKLTLSIQPAHTAALFNLAMMLQDEQRLEEAAELYAKLIITEPDSLDAQSNLAACYHQLGRVSEAVFHYNKAIALVDVKETELVSTLYEHLGRSMLRLPEGTSEAIVDAFSNSLMYNPNNEVAKHLLSSQQQRGEEDNPPETFVRKLFDDYATNFEQSLKNLNYNAPGLLNQFLSQFRASWGTVLDLGCGSGLMGELLKSKANRLVGVDLSPNMLFVAEDKKIYDHLFVGDMIMLLDIVKENRNPRPSDVGRKMQGSNVMDVDRAYGYTWDRMHDNGLLVVAADVLVYLGNLEPLFKSVSQLLKPGDAFAFTVERLEHDGSAGWMLQRSGRFAHKREYIELLATRYNLKKHVAENIIPRMEQGKEIAGLLVIFQK